MRKILLLAGLMLMTRFITASADVDPKFYVYLCFGQSNMEGNATAEAQDKGTVDSRFKTLACVNFDNPKRTMGEWYTAEPPIVRQGTGLGMADYFGRTMVANLPKDITVGVVDVAIGGTSIKGFLQEEVADYVKGEADWFKNYMAAYNNDPYQRLVDMAKIAQQSGVIKGILLHQGETDNGQSDWLDKVKIVYDRLIKDLDLNAEDIPLFVGETVRTEMGGICGYHNTVIAKVPNVIPNSYVISSAECPQKGDGLHFTAQGYRIMGQRYAKTALHLMGIEAEIQEPEIPTGDLVIDKRFTSLEEIGSTPFAIVNEATGMAFYVEGRSDQPQFLDYASYNVSLKATNLAVHFRLEKSSVEGCYLLRCIKMNGEGYSFWGSDAYLNTGNFSCFVLGLSDKNGQDIENGAVWEIEYVDGKGFSLKNKGTGLYFIDTGRAISETPVYFTFCTLKNAESTGIAPIYHTGEIIPDDAVYDLNGRRVNAASLRPGIYIKNRKKIVIR